MRTFDFIRWNGSGDLTPKTVRVINAVHRKHPHLRGWVVTRIVEFAAQLVDLPSMYVMVSIDGSTPLLEVAKAKQLVKDHSRVYLSYLQTHPDEDTQGAAIVFPEKRLAKKMQFKYSPEVCPVDIGKIPLLNGCVACQKCFSPAVLKRQRKLLNSVDSDT